MFKRSDFNRRIAQLADFLTVLVSYGLTYYIWLNFFLNDAEKVAFRENLPKNWLPVIVLLGFVFGFFFDRNNAYNFQRFTSLVREYTILFRVVVLGFLAGIFTLYMFGDKFIFPRKILIINFIVLSVLFFLQKTAMYFIALRVRKHYKKVRVFIVGTGEQAKQLIATIVRNKYIGMKIVGLVGEERSEVGRKIMNHKVVGVIDDFDVLLKQHNPEEVIIALQADALEKVQKIFKNCAEVGVQLRLISEFFSAMTKNLQIDTIYGINFISFYPYHRTEADLLLKRGMDITISALAILLLIPVYLAIALMIWLKDGRPVLYKWQVVGYNRNPITSWKFRTMVNNADALKKELLAKNEMKGPMFKMEKDPRILPFGHFLRRYSLDELPQLFSVLKGDLSLVGPRPPLQYEFKEFELWQMRKLSVKPGLTCLWQVSGRNKINNFDDWVKLDLEYIDNWSLMLDLKILLKTFNAVIKGSGK